MKKLKKIKFLFLSALLSGALPVYAQTTSAELALHYISADSAASDIYQKEIKDRQNTYKESRSKAEPAKISDISTAQQLQDKLQRQQMNTADIERKVITPDFTRNSWENAQESGIKQLDKSAAQRLRQEYIWQDLDRNDSLKKDTNEDFNPDMEDE
ncbi:MAG: hypothetical protein Q4D80_06735 [Pseudomonadota bacterium]|nr:hypothetical protein [Pseudomonadota bacterium]